MDRWDYLELQALGAYGTNCYRIWVGDDSEEATALDLKGALPGYEVKTNKDGSVDIKVGKAIGNGIKLNVLNALGGLGWEMVDPGIFKRAV